MPPETQFNIESIPKVHLSKNVSFQILPTWLASCLWWVFQMSALFANHLALKNKINTIFPLFNVFFLELNQLSTKGDLKAYGAITYDSTGNKLRFRSNESQPINGSMGLDLLMFFNEVQFTFIPWGYNVSLSFALIFGPLICFDRAYSMRLTAKMRAVRKRNCTAPCIRWRFLMMQRFTASWLLEIHPSSGKG